MAAGILKIDRTPDSLRNRRKHLGWTQRLLSMVSGVSLPCIVDFESGRAKLSEADSERLWKVVEAAEACSRQRILGTT